MALGENNGGMEEEDENASDEQQQQVLTEEERKKKVQQRRVAKLAKAAAVEATTRAENDPRGLSTNWGRAVRRGNSGCYDFQNMESYRLARCGRTHQSSANSRVQSTRWIKSHPQSL